MTETTSYKDPLELPYDLYQRYHLVIEVIHHLDAVLGTERRILEIGGDPGILAGFMNTENPVIINSTPDSSGDIIPSDGTALPFRNDSFRGVVMLDVLEHVQEGRREQLLREIDRVSSHWVILGGPFGHESVMEAESILADYYLRLTGIQHRYLAEHKEAGLPDLRRTVEIVQSLGYNTLELPNGLLWRWMLVMGITFFLEKDHSDNDLLTRINRFVNKNLAPSDNREPAYRHIIVGVRQTMPEETWQQIHRLESGGANLPEEDFTASWEGSAAALQTLIADKIRHRDEHIHELEGQIEILEEFRSQVQQSLAYKIYRRWKNLWKRR